ncbi:MAG: CDP-alcohol phosphatidyltransferase family protein [Myxococcota bacterium]
MEAVQNQRWSIHHAAAWGVHVYTSMGLLLALISIDALWRGDIPTFLWLNLIAMFIDGTDGTLARKLRVKELVPFDGALLDNLADFLTYVFLPAIAVVAAGLLPESLRWVVAFPVLASGYQFCQQQAKTEESFVGFPSYWNVLFVYLWVLDATPAFTVASLLVLSALVFLPIHYAYPSRTLLLKRTSLSLGMVWFIAVMSVALNPEATWAETVAFGSLAYGAYYLGVSSVVHRRLKQGLNSLGQPRD